MSNTVVSIFDLKFKSSKEYTFTYHTGLDLKLLRRYGIYTDKKGEAFIGIAYSDFGISVIERYHIYSLIKGRVLSGYGSEKLPTTNPLGKALYD